LKEILCDSVAARMPTLRMALRKPPVPENVLQSVEEDETHLELTQLVPIAALGE
jgi:hypothetical protein